MMVSADDGDALAALLRPLPHYRRDGWLVFEGRRMMARGLAEPAETPLRVRFD